MQYQTQRDFSSEECMNYAARLDSADTDNQRFITL